MKSSHPKQKIKAPKKTLGEFIIENQNQFEYSTGELSRLLNAIRLASKAVNHEVNKAGLVDIIGSTNQINNSNEDQQKLDVFANQVFKRALINRQIVCGFASEEEDESNKNEDEILELYLWEIFEGTDQFIGFNKVLEMFFELKEEKIKEHLMSSCCSFPVSQG